MYFVFCISQVNLSDILRLDAGDADTAAERFLVQILVNLSAGFIARHFRDFSSIYEGALRSLWTW